MASPVDSDHRFVLLLLKGHPGSGKSTLAAGLARALKWPLVDKDDVRDCTHDVERLLTQAQSTGASSATPVYKHTAQDPLAILNALSYSVMWRVASRQLALGLSVVVDCPLARASLFLEGLQLSQKYNARIGVIECRPGDRDEWKRRLENRNPHLAPNSAAGEFCPNSAAGEFCHNSLENQQVGRMHGAKDMEEKAACFPDPPLPEEEQATSAKISELSPELGLELSPRMIPEYMTQGDTYSAGWHKPATWQSMEALLAKYDGCWEYSFADCPHLVLDTTSLETHDVCEEAIEWVKEVFKVSRAPTQK